MTSHFGARRGSPGCRLWLQALYAVPSTIRRKAGIQASSSVLSAVRAHAPGALFPTTTGVRRSWGALPRLLETPPSVQRNTSNLNGPLCSGPVVDRSAMPVRACCSTTEVLFANPLARSTGPALRRPPSGMGIWKELFALANARPVRCVCVLVDGGRGWFAVQVRLIRLLSRRQSIHRLITPAVGDTREGVKITWLGVLEAGVVQDVEELGAPRLRA